MKELFGSIRKWITPCAHKPLVLVLKFSDGVTFVEKRCELCDTTLNGFRGEWGGMTELSTPSVQTLVISTRADVAGGT